MSNRVFVDSSVLVALLVHEADRAQYIRTLERAHARFTSPVAIVETIMVVSSLMRVTPADAEQLLRDYLETHEISIMTIQQETAFGAIRGFEQFGKGRHPAGLNLGDCFSYACAKQHSLKLVYKGNDFARTDLA